MPQGFTAQLLLHSLSLSLSLSLSRSLALSLSRARSLSHTYTHARTHTLTHSLTFTLSSLSLPLLSPSSVFTPPHPPLPSLHFSRSVINRLIGNTTYHQSSGIGAPARFGALQLLASVPTYAVLFPSLSPLSLFPSLSPSLLPLGTWYCSPR